MVNPANKSLAQQHRLMELLETSTDSFHYLIDLSARAAVVADVEGNIVDCNTTAMAQFGFASRGDSIGRSLMELIALDDRVAALKHVRAIQAGAKPEFVEFGMLRLNGTSFVGEVQCSTLRDESGKPAFLVAVLQDATDSRRLGEVTEILLDLTLAVSGSRDFLEAVESLMHAALRIDGLDGAGVYVCDEDSGNMVLVCHAGLSEDFVRAIRVIPPDDPRNDIVRRGVPLHMHRTGFSEAVERHDMSDDFRALSIVPLLVDGRVFGSLNVTSRTTDRVPFHAQKALEIISTQIGTLVARVRAEESAVELRRRLAGAVEEERRRIAGDLHDSIGQGIVAMQMRLGGILADLRGSVSPDVLDRLKGIGLACKELIEDIRGTCHGLYPPTLEKLGLAVALKSLGRDADSDAIEVSVGIDSSLCAKRFDAATEIHLYRIAQEAVHNAIRHAEPSRIDVSLTRIDGELRVCVSDDGKGFNTFRAASGLGIGQMRLRCEALGGQLRIESQSGRTVVTACVPATTLSAGDADEPQGPARAWAIGDANH